MRFISGNLRAIGSLVALAIGDALGAPLEGSARPESWVTEMLPGGRHFRKKGQITDDTIQAMAVAESLAACRGLNQNDLISGYFAGTRNVRNGMVRHLLLSLNWSKSGTLPHKAAWLVHKRCMAAGAMGVSCGEFLSGFSIPHQKFMR